MRYTKQWRDWFFEVAKSLNLDFTIVDGDTIGLDFDTKGFLQITDTMYWRSVQMRDLLGCRLRDGDTILSMDGEFLTLDALAYIKKMEDKKIGLYGIWHAGTYDVSDLVYTKGCIGFGHYLEMGQFELVDKIFVASTYHKNMICSRRNVNPLKVIVTGLPVDVDGLIGNYKKNGSIVFTGRLSNDKGWDIVQEMRKKGHNIIATHELNLSKDKYYDLLKKSSAVFAPSRHENFGYGIVEGMACNCEPIVPDGLSFREYVPRWYRYKCNAEIETRFKTIIKHHSLFLNVLHYQYQKVITNMYKEMGVV